jgi:signal transduction histidine kinase
VTHQVLQEKRTFTTTPGAPVETSASVIAFLQARNIASFMLVPLVAAGETLGVMAVNSAAPDRAFTADEVRLAETIAADVAAAVANLHLLAQTKETAALQERQRIASELHDSVTQTIYSVSIMAQTVPRLLREEKLGAAVRNANQIRLTTLGALAQMRTLLFELRPAALAEARLGVLLQQLGDAFTGQTHVPVDLVVRGDGQPTVDVKIAFYRIAQEAFNNIAKHAQATQVAATLRSAPDTLEMTIVDDGSGFDVTSNHPGSMGLRIMGERAAEIGAELQLESQPGGGTTVTIMWKAG